MKSVSQVPGRQSSAKVDDHDLLPCIGTLRDVVDAGEQLLF
jgi:hypothetical protein